MTNVKLSKRLKKIADLVDKDSNIIDIGCDHALLDIYLCNNKIIKKSIACDITIGAINIAKKNISMYDVKNVDLRLGDGLNVLRKEDFIDTIVMSGLGNITILKILKDNLEKLNTVKTIIIQSNTNVKNIREDITKLGFYIEDEVLIKENNIIYTIIKFNKGIKKYTSKQILFGPILLKNKDILFKELINEMINKNENLLKKIPKKKIGKIVKLMYLNYKLKKEI